MAQKIKVKFTWADNGGGPREEIVEMEYYFYCNNPNLKSGNQEGLRDYIRTHFHGDPNEFYFCNCCSIGDTWWE